MAAALFFHLGDRELRDVKEAGEVDGQHRRVIGLGVELRLSAADRALDAP
jgi:hypothetical protein